MVIVVRHEIWNDRSCSYAAMLQNMGDYFDGLNEKSVSGESEKFLS